jgi:para-aminobenzoate synthetase/4-amino-4-deoxychorismate lyase
VTASSRPSAIVDFTEHAGHAPRRLCFESPSTVISVSAPRDVLQAIDDAERLAREGRWVVGFVSYEAGPAFDPALAAAPASPLPLAWFAAFDEPQSVDSRASSSEPRDRALTGAEFLLPRPAVLDDDYASAVHRIHEHIDAGDVYQVNLTVPFVAPTLASPLALYEQMRTAQGGAYACYLDIGGAQILSASPELFFERRGALVQSRPMKGTAPRGLHPRADDIARATLLRSEKDRAENVMIVDVVRNDLGRIAQVGGVRVTALYEAERYPSVWQLTSTVEADIDQTVPLSAIFRALFPPASITGAPKVRATRIIRELEPQARGVYCGAIGIVRPGGDATFNVAIRTGWMATGSGELHVHAGGGVTSDSTARGELRELRDKLAAFTSARATPALFETLRIEDGRPVRFERHLARLTASADYFGIPFRPDDAIRALADALASSTAPELARGRLELSPEGSCSAAVDVHPGLPASDPAFVVIAAEPVDRSDVRLYHKTTDRTVYDRVSVLAPDAFDVVLWNADGEVTELTRGNLVVQRGNERVTPPIDCGLLAGTLRAELVDRGEIREGIITVEELRRANRVWFVNSLRGWVEVRLQS